MAKEIPVFLTFETGGLGEKKRDFKFVNALALHSSLFSTFPLKLKRGRDDDQTA